MTTNDNPTTGTQFPTDGETWADVPGYGGLIQASSHGRIRKVELLNQTECGDTTYLAVCFRMPDPKDATGETTIRVKRNVHRLVAGAFMGVAPHKMVVDHKDGNKHNNSRENLEYVTHKENTARAYKLGLIQHKLSESQMDEISQRYFDAGESMREIADQMSLTVYQVKSVVMIWRQGDRKGRVNPHERKLTPAAVKAIRNFGKSPRLTHAQIAEKINAAFHVMIDASYVGKILSGTRRQSTKQQPNEEAINDAESPH